MPDNDTSETLYSFGNNSYVPVEDTAHQTVFMEAESLFVTQNNGGRNRYTAYADNALCVNESAEYISFDIHENSIGTPWSTDERESSDSIGSAREFGWHFRVGTETNTSDILADNIERFLVDSADDIPEGDLSGDLFDADRFVPGPITEDHRQLPDGVLLEVDDGLIEIVPENAVVTPSTHGGELYLVCQDLNILRDSNSVFGSSLMSREQYMAANVTDSTDIDVEYNAVVINGGADAQLSEFMVSLDDDIEFTDVTESDGIVFETEEIRENQIMLERETGQVENILTSHDSVKGYTVETEGGTEVDIPATSVVWAESSIDDIPAWAR